MSIWKRHEPPALQVDSMDEAVDVLREHHVDVGEPRSPDGTAGF